MNELFFANRLDFHKHPIGITPRFVLTNGKRLPAPGRALVNDIKLRWRIGFEEIPKNKLSLCFTIGIHFITDGHINSLIEKPGEFFRATGLNGLLNLSNNLGLGKTSSVQGNNDGKNYVKNRNV